MAGAAALRNSVDAREGAPPPCAMERTTPRLPELLVGLRVTLRRWRADDVPALSDVVEHNVEHLRPFMAWAADEPMGSRERVELIESWDRSWRDGGDVGLGVFAGGRIIGGCGLHRRRGPHGLEIGYWVDKDHLRQGVGTEVGRLLTAAALAVPDVTFVEIRHDKANVASAGIPRRLGYEFVGEVPGDRTAPARVGIDCVWRMQAVDWPDGRETM